ncbi:MAG: hypothetical protein J6V98_08505 [Bacteroidales bacterium]|nr:hypothetical protein [Bacteroidales bacterium]
MKQRILFAALALLLFAACHKETLDPRMEIFVEHMQGSAKLTLDGVNATWNNGDTLRLNGTRVVVERSGDHAYISNAASQSTNRALFPTRLVASGPASDAVTVTLPREYDYRSDGSHQLLDLPLAARATDGEPLHFKHLTGALCFMLTNNTSNPLTIDRITVSSSSYQLSGEREINLTAIGSIGPVAGAGDDRTVSMTFTRQSLEIPASGTANVVLPIAPVGSDNIFTVTVVSHYQGNRYVYSKTQGEGKTDRSLNRNEIGYAAVNLSGMAAEPLFSGDGTVSYPFLITSATDFLLMAEAITNNWECPSPRGYYKNFTYQLTNNLDLNNYTIHPIQNYDYGTFDGNNKTINGLTINSENGYCALFKTLTHGLIKDLTLQNLTLKHNGNVTDLFVGGISGTMNTQSISNCTVTGTTYDITGNITYAYIGGIVGRAEGSDTLTSCNVTTSSSLTISAGTLYYGNLIGRCYRNSLPSNIIRLSNCTTSNPTFSINTTGALQFGGIIGNTYNEATNLNNCDYTGTVELTYSGTCTAGGLIGRYTQSTSGSLSIDNCRYRGTFNGVAIGNDVGG